jgi:hypothetical protein
MGCTKVMIYRIFKAAKLKIDIQKTYGFDQQKNMISAINTVGFRNKNASPTNENCQLHAGFNPKNSFLQQKPKDSPATVT